jgi:hypothetical protein
MILLLSVFIVIVADWFDEFGFGLSVTQWLMAISLRMSSRASVKFSTSKWARALACLRRRGVMALDRRFLAHPHQHVNI